VLAGERGERHEGEGEEGGEELVLNFLLPFFPSAVLKKLIIPPVIPTSAPAIVSQGTLQPIFRSAQMPSAVNAPTATTRLVDAARYGAALR
jgi:hypothetical protein